MNDLKEKVKKIADNVEKAISEFNNEGYLITPPFIDESTEYPTYAIGIIIKNDKGLGLKYRIKIEKV